MSTRKLHLRSSGLAVTALLVLGCGAAPIVPTVVPTPILPPPAAAPSATVAAEMTQPSVDAIRIQFEPNATSWSASGEMAPGTSVRYVLSALAGQPMTVTLTTQPDAGPSATVSVQAADGQVLTPDITANWTGVLPGSQDYTIEVRSMDQQVVTYTLLVAIAAVGSTPYVPVTPEVCAMIQEMATQAVGATFTMEASAPFTNPKTGEAGQGCTLTATGTGVDFADPFSVMTSLINGMLGWTEDITYQASGPTGGAAAMTRDMALMVIDVGWMPSAEVQCPADQPISACDLKPEQKVYTIRVQTAMK